MATPSTTSIAPGLPGGADPAMQVTGPTVVPAGAVPAVVTPKPPAPPVAPAVITAGQAAADVNSKMAVVNNLSASQVTAPQPMATLVNPTTGDRKAVPVGSQQAQGLFGSGYILETKGAPAPGAPASPTVPATSAGQAAANQPTGLTPLPNAPTAPDTATQVNDNIADFKANSDALTAKSDAAFADYSNSVNQIRNGTFPLSPDQQAQIDAITQQYQNLLADQKIANRDYEGAVRQAGISAGRNMYAPEVELGNANAAVAAGARTLADINAKMASAVTSAKIAFQQQNFEMLDSVYEKLQTHIKDQREVVKDTYDKVKDALDAAQQKFTDDLASSQFEFQKAVELNKPILEADSKMKDYLYDQMQKYPDAGITQADTIATAVEKIKNSPTYIALKKMEALDLEQAAASIEATKASTAASKAATAASYASAARSRAEAEAALKATGLTDDQVQTAFKLRAEFNAQTKDFDTVANSYNLITTAAKDPSAAGDLSLIFAYMKMLDPGSTVREGEYANAQNAGSVPNRVIGQYNAAVNGKKLADPVRNDFVLQSGKIYRTSKEQYDKTKDIFDADAANFGIDPKYVTRDKGAVSDSAFSVTAGDGKTYSFSSQEQLDEFKKAAGL